MHEIRFRRRVEYVDTDMSGIMHFSRYLVFMENAEHAFLEALGARVQWREGEREMTFPRVAVACEYLAPARFGDELEVHLRVLRKGEKSLTYGFEVTRAGQLILGMLDGTQVVATDLTAIIAGSAPNAPPYGWFPAGSFPVNVTYPQREQPFREFTIIYHDETGAVQAFPQFEDEVLHHTLQSGRDAFAINYGTAGVGAEVLANRIGVGPMAGCTECKFEEFLHAAAARL